LVATCKALISYAIYSKSRKNFKGLILVFVKADQFLKLIESDLKVRIFYNLAFKDCLVLNAIVKLKLFLANTLSEFSKYFITFTHFTSHREALKLYNSAYCSTVKEVIMTPLNMVDKDVGISQRHLVTHKFILRSQIELVIVIL